MNTGQEINIMETNIDCISVPVKCNSCQKSHILIAEDIETQVSDTERGMGTEKYHYATAYGTCEKCNKDLEASISICEYPERPITFEDDFISEKIDCKYDNQKEIKD